MGSTMTISEAHFKAKGDKLKAVLMYANAHKAKGWGLLLANWSTEDIQEYVKNTKGTPLAINKLWQVVKKMRELEAVTEENAQGQVMEFEDGTQKVVHLKVHKPTAAFTQFTTMDYANAFVGEFNPEGKTTVKHDGALTIHHNPDPYDTTIGWSKASLKKETL